MGLFDNDEEEIAPKTQQDLVREYISKKYGSRDAGPAVADANMDVKERKYDQAPLADKYEVLAGDTSAADKAQADADSANKWVSIIQGIGTMFAGKDKMNNGAFDAMRAGNAAHAAAAKDAHKQKVADLLTKDKLQRQDVERGQEDTKFGQSQKKFGWEAEDEDPAAPKAVTARALVAKSTGSDPKMFESLNYKEVLEVGKQLQAARDAAKRNSGDNFQQTNIEIPGKGVFKATFNPTTGAFQVTEHLSGYKGAIDNTTGTRTSGADFTAPATPIMSADGVTPMSEVRTDLEGTRSYVKGTAGQQVKNEQEVKVADADVAHTDDMLTRWKGLYDKASKEGPAGNTGPVAGRVAQAASRAGVDMGPATNEAATEMEREMQAYVVKMTGLSSTDQQFKRLMSTAPHLGMSPEQFAARSKVWQDEVKRTQKKKRDVAFPAGAKQRAGGTDSPAAGAFPRKVTRTNPETGKTESTEVENEAELKEAQTEGFQ
jgi:hypothetical protein